MPTKFLLNKKKKIDVRSDKKYNQSNHSEDSGFMPEQST